MTWSEAILPVGLIALGAYAVWMLLGGGTSGTGGTTTGGAQRSWICNTFSLGCPSDDQNAKANDLNWANTTLPGFTGTPTPTQAANAAEWTQEVQAAFQAGNYNSLGDIAPGWGITIVPASIGGI